MKTLEEADLLKTIDEMVALMINLNYIPSGISLLEMTDAFLYMAEEDYERAKSEASFYKLEALRLRVESCRCRHELAQSLIAQLTHEAENLDDLKLESPDDFMIDIDDQSPPHICYANIIDWAYVNLGINIPELQISPHVKKISWEDVTIKIYKDNRIGYKIKDRKFKLSTFEKMGLLNKRNHDPTTLGCILIGLSEGKKFPGNGKPQAKDKTAISKIRRLLEKLIGLKDDPFYPITEADGWKPRFKLIDDRKNADERAKAKATHVPFNEDRD